MKLNRCHSANTQDGEGTQFFIYISYRKQKKKKSHQESHLDSFQLQRNVRIKTEEEFTQEETGSGFALQGWKQGYNK